MAHATNFNRYGLRELTMAESKKEDKGSRDTCCPKCHCDPCCCAEQAEALKEASKADLERVLHERRQCALRTVDTERIQTELSNRR